MSWCTRAHEHSNNRAFDVSFLCDPYQSLRVDFYGIRKSFQHKICVTRTKLLSSVQHALLLQLFCDRKVYKVQFAVWAPWQAQFKWNTSGWMSDDCGLLFKVKVRSLLKWFRFNEILLGYNTSDRWVKIELKFPLHARVCLQIMFSILRKKNDLMSRFHTFHRAILPLLF